MARDLGTIKKAIAGNAWWAAPPLVVGTVLTVTAGLWVLLAYVVANISGVWFYADHHGARHARRQRWMKLLALVLLPSGVFGVLGTGGGATPSETSSGASSDPNVRTASARVGPPGGAGPGGHCM